ncbi:retrotransposon gag family protein, partial [Escherichia coli]|uniref:retrotransposon gag family protein n=1 Tax=Escherichia coli TaxID=562 RepID=UPI003079FAA2
MTRYTRSHASRTVAGNNNADGERERRAQLGKSPIREETPEGHIQSLDEHGHPALQEAGYHSEGNRSNNPGEHPAPQVNLDDVVKGFLEKNKESFLQFLSEAQGRPRPEERYTEASSRYEASQREVGAQTDRARNEQRGRGRRDRREASPDRQNKSIQRTPPRSPGDEQRRKRHQGRREVGPSHLNEFDRRTPSQSPEDGFDGYGKIVTPFSNRILNTSLPDKYRVPSIAPYDGLRDPQNFLSQFQYNMINQRLSSVHMCKLFPELLVDNARRWFDSLPTGSIGSYRDLMAAFHRRFFQKAESKTSSAHLLTIRQSRNESISDFMTRFNKECLKVEDVNDLLVISAFQNGILPGALYREIVKYEPRTATELWRIADRFAKADEADKKKREADKAEPSEKGRRDEGREDRNQGRRSALERLHRPIRSRLGPRDASERPQYTPLTKPRAEIYALHMNLFEKPRPMTGGKRCRPMDKYCSFHDDYGHDIEECKELMGEIEMLVQDGSLKKYRGQSRQADQSQKKKKQRKRGNCAPYKKTKRSTDEEGDDEPQYDGVVSTITGLPRGVTKSSLKAEARSPRTGEPTNKRFRKDEAITFSEDDPVPATVPHQDALVIQAVVANKLVKRVYIDSGASVS